MKKEVLSSERGEKLAGLESLRQQVQILIMMMMMMVVVVITVMLIVS